MNVWPAYFFLMLMTGVGLMMLGVTKVLLTALGRAMGWL